MAAIGSVSQLSNPYILKPPAYSNILTNAIKSKNQNEIEAAFNSLERVGNPSNFSVNDLGRTLLWAIQNNFENFSRRVLGLQPFVGHIPATGEYGLGHALIEAIKKEDGGTVSEIDHQNAFAQIPVIDSVYGLNFALLASLRLVICNHNPRYAPHAVFLRVLLAHPNMGQLNRNRDLNTLDPLLRDPFGKALAKADSDGYRDIAVLIRGYLAAHN